MKSFKPQKINIKTENKKLFIKKHRDCGKSTTVKQNQAGIVVFKKQPLLTTFEKLQNSKNQFKKEILVKFTHRKQQNFFVK